VIHAAHLSRPLAALLLVLTLTACGNSTPTSPSTGAIAVIQVSGETFRVALNTPQQIAAAQAAMAGGASRIPNGRIVAGTEVNVGWSWHLENVEFAFATIEVCDGKPSDVERLGTSFGAGRFCPWISTIVRIDPR
jgi:hypothetical protein